MNFFQKITKITAILVFSLASQIVAADEISSEVLEKIRKGVVTIESRISISAYEEAGGFNGTGFIADKESGLLVTNAHVISPASVGIYFITFSNGKQTEAKVLYYDAWQDFAILKIDPKETPEEATEIKFTDEDVKLGQDVFIVGNNESQGFSFHSGYLANLYEISGSMPQHTYIVNLNTAGGSSGSPLVNLKGEAIGLNYGGSKTFGMSLKGQYISYALKHIKEGKTPNRYHMGAITEIYSLDKAVNHRNFPKDIMDDYIKNKPEYRNRVISVSYSIKGSTSHNLLKAGDIIWAVGGKEIGADLSKLDKAMNKAKNKKVTLTIYRNGDKINVDVPLYDTEKYKVKTLLDFAGGIVYEADSFSSAKFGVPLGKVFMVNSSKGGAMSTIPTHVRYGDQITYRLKINKLDHHRISNLESLIKALPEIIAKKFITIDFTNFQPIVERYNQTLQSGHNYMSSDLTLDALDKKPRILRYNGITGDWTSEDVR